MRALMVDAFGAPPEVREVPDPVPPDDGVVVEVGATGLCRSDWHGWAGHDPDIVLPHVPGHEFAGTVAAAGADVTRVRVGDRVTVPFVCGCGTCATCRAGAPQVCERQFQPGFTAWGSFATYVVIPRAHLNVVRLPDEMSTRTAAGLGCRFATAYRAVTAHARVEADQWVVVIGCGGVGLAATMIAAARGARVIAIDPAEGARALAAEFGAHATIPPGDSAAIGELTGDGAHVAIDALGSGDAMRVGIESLRPRGRHVQVGLMVGPDAFAPAPMAQVLARELEVYGSHGMAAADYPAMLAEIASGRLRPDVLVTGDGTLDDLAGPAGRLATMGENPPTGMLVVVP